MTRRDVDLTTGRRRMSHWLRATLLLIHRLIFLFTDGWRHFAAFPLVGRDVRSQLAQVPPLMSSSSSLIGCPIPRTIFLRPLTILSISQLLIKIFANLMETVTIQHFFVSYQLVKIKLKSNSIELRSTFAITHATYFALKHAKSFTIRLFPFKFTY